MGVSDRVDDPFLTLAFISLPVIPELNLTDKGLFDTNVNPSEIYCVLFGGVFGII